eukprot:44330_1
MGDLEGVELQNETHQNTAGTPGAKNSAIHAIHCAISSLEKEIYESEQNRKQTQILIEKEFTQIIQQMMTKKVQSLQQMHSFYDEQRERSLNRISELKNELITTQKHIQSQTRRKSVERLQKQQQLKRMEEAKQKEIEANKGRNDEDDHKQNIGDIIKDNASKFAVHAGQFVGNASKDISKAVTFLDALIRNEHKEDTDTRQALYSKHDKLRLFIPKKELDRLIENDIKLSTEWWDTLTMNHIIFKHNEDELWRGKDITGGWYNAFGVVKVRKGQIKRWNIRIGEKVKQNQKQAVDVVLGVIESNKACAHDTDGGFWMKGFDGFGLHGLHGKLQHKQRSKTYCEPLYVGSSIGIELNMKDTPAVHAHTA